jgi:alpha-galactosidase
VTQNLIVWGHDRLEAVLEVDDLARASWQYLGPPRVDASPVRPQGDLDETGARTRGAPLVEVVTAATGTMWSGTRYVDSTVGGRLLYRSHHEEKVDEWSTLSVDLADPDSGLRIRLKLQTIDGLPVLRSSVIVTNEGPDTAVLHAVSCLAMGRIGTTEAATAIEDLELVWVDNEWLSEVRGRRSALREVLPDVGIQQHDGPPRGCFRLQSQGSWSTGEHLPMGALTDLRTNTCWIWQVEHCGGWHWQVGERTDGAYLLLTGPTDREHQWQLPLPPGESFETVAGALVVTSGDFGSALAELTTYRRLIRRKHSDHTQLPVIYSDYMNTLKGDPSADKLLSLVEAAAEVGVEYFCIDAGWYADSTGWWEDVGAWQPARTRFPRGLGEVVDRIQALGMVAGLFLEPEVVGIRSELGRTLPDDAFFQRAGVRLIEHGRYHLDLRSDAALAHVDEVVDRLVADFGIGYLKLDYNVNIGPGTDTGAQSPGSGLLGHNRAYLAWLDGISARYPRLVIENCASGGQRMDHALLSRTQVQSMTDQQVPSKIVAIAAAAPLALPPEQAAIWAYPQPGFTDEEIAFTICGALLGRVTLSGFIDRMSPHQRALVTDGMAVYKAIRGDLAVASPFWPLGLPGWVDSWLALGMHALGTAYVAVWKRDGADSIALRIAPLEGVEIEVTLLYPTLPRTNRAPTWDPAAGVLDVALVTGQAALYKLTPRDGPP